MQIVLHMQELNLVGRVIADVDVSVMMAKGMVVRSSFNQTNSIGPFKSFIFINGIDVYVIK